jgi:hypothetical protein
VADASGDMSTLESLLGDRYTREARIAPAFLCVFPVAILLMVWFSSLQELVPLILMLMCVFGVVRWISHMARAEGDKSEMEYFRKWGGKPTTTMLRVALGYEEAKKVQCDDRVRHLLSEAPHAHDFRQLLAARKAPAIPSESEDKKAVHEAGGHSEKRADNLDALYEPLVAWMRENSRASKLVFEEEISYGFQRNFFALKSFALWSNGLALAVQVGVIWGVYQWQHQHVWAMQPAPAAVILAANMLYLIGVVLSVTEESVKVQGFVYARQLFDSFYGATPAGEDGEGKKEAS